MTYWSADRQHWGADQEERAEEEPLVPGVCRCPLCQEAAKGQVKWAMEEQQVEKELDPARWAYDYDRRTAKRTRLFAMFQTRLTECKEACEPKRNEDGTISRTVTVTTASTAGGQVLKSRVMELIISYLIPSEALKLAKLSPKTGLKAYRYYLQQLHSVALGRRCWTWLCKF